MTCHSRGARAVHRFITVESYRQTVTQGEPSTCELELAPLRTDSPRQGRSRALHAPAAYQIDPCAGTALSSRVPSLAHLAFGAVLRNASDIELYQILYETGWDVAIRMYQVLDLPDHQATPHLQPDDFGCVSVGAHHQLVQ
jgi:hypothetical protein